MASIFKKDKRKGSTYYIEYTDEHGQRQRVAGCPDRSATAQIARKLETEVALRRSGVIDHESARHVESSRKPLADHLDDFHRHLIAKGNTAKHADLFVDRARRVVALTKGGSLADIDPPRNALAADRIRAAALTGKLLANARISDLTSTAVQSALACLKDGGRALGTCNHHRAAIRGFTTWLVRDKRLKSDPLADVSGFNAKEDRRHDRRTLELDDLRRLVEAAQTGATYRKMTGPSRALCYRLAVATGLRFSEIASIKPESFDWSPGSATVTVEAGYTKNGDPATLPLPDDVATALRPWVADLPAGSPVFSLPSRGADMLKVDLAAAGIPYRNAAGRVFDFHSLRCQTATLADHAGESPRLIQAMMRHSTLELTGRYTRHSEAELGRVAMRLPTLGTRLAESAPDTASDATGDHDDFPNSLSEQEVAEIEQRNHNPRVGGSNPSAAIHDRPRQDTSSPTPIKGLRQVESDDESRQRPTACDTIRHLPTASDATAEFAYGFGIQNPLSDPDRAELAELVGRWPDLPATIRHAILAIVRSATPTAQDEGEPGRPSNTRRPGYCVDDEAACPPVDGREERHGFVELTTDPGPARDPLDARSRSDRRSRREDERG